MSWKSIRFVDMNDVSSLVVISGSTFLAENYEMTISLIHSHTISLYSACTLALADVLLRTEALDIGGRMLYLQVHKN